MPCSPGCGLCKSLTSCTNCVVSAFDNNNGSCTCPSGYYFATTPTRYCSKCSNYCTSCSSPDACTSCLPNFKLIQGVCVCPLGWFIQNGTCTSCANGCASCGGLTNCTGCKPGTFLQNGICVSRCSVGFYQDGGACSPCPSLCSFCQQANICVYCQSNMVMYNGLCYKGCPPGSVIGPDNITCVACNTPCNTCMVHPSKCTSCLPGCGNIFNNECVNNCPVGTFANNGTCTYCSYSCASCLGTSTTCTACPLNKILYNGQCYDQCPYIMIAGVCTFNCGVGYYKVYPNQCFACSPICTTCNNTATNCTSCVSGFAFNGTCIQACPNNTLAIKGYCWPCDPSCFGCTGVVSTCTACAAGYVKCGTQCLTSCYPNQYVDSLNTCQSCNPSCNGCTNASFCTACANSSYTPVNGFCTGCAYPCATCTPSNKSTCITCLTGFYLVGSTCSAQCPAGSIPSNGVCVCQSGFIYQSQCTQSCPPGTLNVGGNCQSCSPYCSSCSVSGACLACQSGYQLDPVSQTCKILVNCQFGQYFSSSAGSCQRICPAPYVYYDSVCLGSCIVGYVDNGVGGCVPISVTTGCSSPYFLYQGACVSSCPAQTYPDTTQRSCLPCSLNCFSCLNPSFCYGCVAGFDLYNGICIASSTPCPSGQFRYNGACYASCPVGTCSRIGYCERSCPAGTYFYNQGCYATCLTGLKTNEACVNTCPAGTVSSNGNCVSSNQTCGAGTYFDTTTATCMNCQYPCTSCSLTASYCTACSSGMILTGNLCSSSGTGCQTGSYQNYDGSCGSCPAKCAQCVSATICSSCASGYQFNGNDCVLGSGQLTALTLNIVSVTRRDNTAFIIVGLNVVPNGLTTAQASKFFLVVPNKGDNCTYINQWIGSDPNTVVVAATYQNFPLQSALFLAVNAQILAQTYASIGYTANSNSFVSATISQNLGAAPAYLNTPSYSIANAADSVGDFA